MKTLNFNELNKTGNLTYDILNALRICKEKKYNKLTFPKSVYELDQTFCAQKSLNISNHGLNGPKRIGFLIDEMENFELDFSGSTLTANDVLIPIALINSKNITVKNVTLDVADTNVLQGEVVELGKDSVKLKITHSCDRAFIEGGKLFATYGREYLYIKRDMMLEINPTTGEIEYGTGDAPLGDNNNIAFEREGEYLILRNLTRLPKLGNVLITHVYCRSACGTLVDKCENVTLENLTVHSCFGMGLLAQFSKDITLNSFNLIRKEGRYYTANADATHFVSCKGIIKVENCKFENQLDDALNIHGVYLRVVQKLNDSEFLIKLMHCQATGLPVVEKGDELSAVKSDSLLPFENLTVEDFEFINDEIIKLKFAEKVKNAKVGDNFENLTKQADLIFRNNKVLNNRARGMLIATKGKVEIENNYFHTSGSAITFESDGKWWFESGGTKEVYIKNNFFDKCKYAKWGNAVIEFVKREKEEEGKFYHGTVIVENNKFNLLSDKVAIFNNINVLKFINNEIIGLISDEECVSISHCNSVEKNC